MKIVSVSDLIEKGRWRHNHYFYLRAAKLSETKSIDEYFVIHAQRVESENGEKKTIKTIRAAFCFQSFLKLDTPDVESIIKIEDHDVYYRSISNHPDNGYTEIERVMEWRDYITFRPELIEFAINDKTSLLSYEEYQ